MKYRGGSRWVEQALDEADSYAKYHTENMTHDKVFSKLRSKLNG